MSQISSGNFECLLASWWWSDKLDDFVGAESDFGYAIQDSDGSRTSAIDSNDRL
jgi:hypothetical protein